MKSYSQLMSPEVLRKQANAWARLLWAAGVYHTKPIYAFTGDCAHFIVGCTLDDISQLWDSVLYTEDLSPRKYWVDPDDGDEFCMPQVAFGLDSSGNIEARVEVWDVDEVLSQKLGEECRQLKTIVRRVCSPVLMFSLIQTLKKLGLIFYE